MRAALPTLVVALGAAGAAALAAPLVGAAQSPAEVCGPPEPGVTCAPGDNRTPAGGAGAGKVPHNDGAGRAWPALSGILWQVTGAPGDHAKAGGPANDWGDWDPSGNTRQQRDRLYGGAGDDWLYPSHGRSLVAGGPGSDYVWAFYGTGTIDCGPGIDTARIRTNGAFRMKHCERVRHFCAHGENTRGQCLSPTGRPVTAARRTG
jgi:hypothetical protein